MRRIVLLKPCCLGDLVQATAVVTSLHERWPDASIAVGAGRWSLPAVAAHPDVTATIDIGNAGVRARQRPFDLLRLCWQLRAGRFDLAVVPDRSPVLSLATLLAGIPVRAGLDSGGRGRFYTLRVSPLPRAHELDQSGRLLAALGAGPLPLPRFYPDEQARAEMRALLGQLNAEKSLALLAPGGGENPGTRMPSKRWTTAGFASVALALIDAGAAVAVVGGMGDHEAARSLVQAVPRARNLTGITSIGGLGALQQHARLHVGNDSGTSHLAAAAGCPTVAIFGPTEPAFYGPRGPWVRVLAPPSACRTGGDGTVRQPFTYRRPWQDDVPVDTVVAAALEGLRRAPARSPG